MTIFNRIMYELATKNVVPKTVLLNTITNNPIPVYRQIQKAIKAGLAREISHTTTFNREQLTTDCLVLTPDGVRYIKNNLADVIPWADYIDSATDGISVIGGNYNKQRIVSRFSKLAAAALMADNIGACESKVFYADFSNMIDSERQASAGDDDGIVAADDDESADGDEVVDQYESESNPTMAKPTLGKMITDAMEKYALASQRLADITHNTEAKKTISEIVFYDALTIKRTIEQRSIEQNVLADIKGGRYAGILDSPIRSCLVYTASAQAPLVWYKRFLERELRAFNIIKRIQTGYDHVDESTNGILLVSSPKAFERTYNAHLYARNPRSKSAATSVIPECGDKLTHLWVVPFTNEGNAELLALMTTDVKQEREAIIKDLLATDEYVLSNNDVSNALFPVEDSFGTLIAIGTHMDVKRMKAIDRMASTGFETVHEFAVLCFRWQVPYYEAVLQSDNIEIIAVDDELKDYVHDWSIEKPMLAIEKEANLWAAMMNDKLVSESSEAKRKAEVTSIVNALLEKDPSEKMMTKLKMLSEKEAGNA